MKPLVLLSFSLTFLTQGIANDFSHEETSALVQDEEYDDDQLLSFDDEDYLSDASQPNSSMSSQPPAQQQEWCLSPYHEMHASIRTNQNRGIGYNEGYTTLEAFGIYDGYGSSFMPFLDLRGHVFNNGRLAGNLGIGERTLFTSINHTLGSYVYYDVRRVGHGLTVNQLSPGIELVGERMEYRINGYFPIGKQKGHQYGFEFDDFKGNNIILKSKQQQAMRGFDAEVGAHLTQSTKYDLYLAAGPYYFSSSNASSWGGRTRLLGRYKEYITLEVAYSYDHLFRSVVQGSVALTLPFGSKLQRCGPCCPQTDNLLLSRAAFAPSRFEIPVVKKAHRRERAINPETGDPWVVWFVNNTSHSAGTYESPFPTLLLAQNASSPNEMIYVFPGDGTTTGMNAGITLKDGQSFFGSGTKQQFATSKGSMMIPAYTANNPSITHAAGNVVTIGNNNTVSGFNINFVGNQIGIASPITNIGVVGGTIINNVFTSSATVITSAAVYVYGSGGTFDISNNQLDLGGTGGDGILIAPVGGTITGRISNNFITTVTIPILLSSVNHEGPPITGFSNYNNFVVEGNIINTTNTVAGTPGVLGYLPQTSSVHIVGNLISVNALGADWGINMNDDSTSTSATLSVIGNQINLLGTGTAFGMELGVANSASSLGLTIINNSVNSQSTGAGSTDYSIISVSSGSSVCLTFDNNIAINPPVIDAFTFRTASTGVLNIDSFQSNVGGPTAMTGTSNVFFVPRGTCGN